MARSTAPSLISYTEVPYATNLNTITSASVAWQTGDVIVVIIANEGPNTLGTPTATGLTFTQQQSNAAAGTCATKVATAIAASSSSGAISAIASTGHVGMGVWVWRGSDGVGASTEQHTATKTKSMTPTDTHSAFCWTVADFNAGAATDALTPTPTTTQEAALDAGHYTVYSGNLDDQASASATLFGITGAAATGPFSIAAVEILGTGAATELPLLVMAPMRASRR